jgi:hypothetical protein
MPLHQTGFVSRRDLLHPEERKPARTDLPPFERVLKTGNPYKAASGLFTSKQFAVNRSFRKGAIHADATVSRHATAEEAHAAAKEGHGKTGEKHTVTQRGTTERTKTIGEYGGKIPSGGITPPAGAKYTPGMLGGGMKSSGVFQANDPTDPRAIAYREAQGIPHPKPKSTGQLVAEELAGRAGGALGTAARNLVEKLPTNLKNKVLDAAGVKPPKSDAEHIQRVNEAIRDNTDGERDNVHAISPDRWKQGIKEAERDGSDDVTVKVPSYSEVSVSLAEAKAALKEVSKKFKLPNARR